MNEVAVKARVKVEGAEERGKVGSIDLKVLQLKD